MAISDDTNFLSKLGCFRICSPNRYYRCFPKFNGFFILFVSNVSLWLFIMFRWMLFLSFFVLGAWLNEGNIEFSLSADSCLSWHSSMGRISDEFLRGVLQCCWWFRLVFLFLQVKWNENRRIFLRRYKLQKNPSLHFEQIVYLY